MARPLSPDKRNAILAAAAEAVASLGTSAPTAKIAGMAEIAEGTLFSYFETKDVLLNELYIAIKSDMAATILTGHRPEDSLPDRWRDVWNRYIDWGADHPVKRKAVRQLAVSDRITRKSWESAENAIREISTLLDESLRSGEFRDQSREFLMSTMEALAEMTLNFVAREPERREHYKRAGFETLWNAISRR
jgi:AcrR family transcriptional regulator